MTDDTPNVAGLVATLEKDIRAALASVELLKKTVVKPKGRPRRFNDEMRIYKRVPNNPYPMENGKRHQIFDMFEEGGLVGDFRKRVIASRLGDHGWGYLGSNARRGYIEVK